MTQLADTDNDDALSDEVRLDDLIHGHQLRIPEEPLRLAIQLMPADSNPTMQLLEVVENFGRNEVVETRELMDVVFNAPIKSPTRTYRDLRLILTNPVEAVVAFRERWPGTEPIREAVRAGRYQLLYGDEADPVMGVIRG